MAQVKGIQSECVGYAVMMHALLTRGLAVQFWNRL